MGAPLRRLARERGMSHQHTAQRFTALRTRVLRRTPSGAGAASMASTSFLAFLAFFAAGLRGARE